ncbi:pentapeptide repeat-containing protein [Rhizobium puerariae]|uniref:Pentapeptide repeat-containing protein n=1 Tax=Rhizobium puerariae TaxID=1585791 RepID=A0ABV6AMZ6_9HYPH
MTRRELAILTIVSWALAAVAGFIATPLQAQDCRSSPYAGVDWHGCGKKSLMLDGSDFVQANLAEVDFSYTDLRNSIFTSADLTKAKLIRAALAGARADRANFQRVEAYRAGFQGVRANGSSFLAAELQRADFSEAELKAANFRKADLSRAIFDRAIITGVSFAYANLSRADLTTAIFDGPIDFQNAFLFQTRIEGMDLSAATGLDQHQLDMACGNALTRLPAGLAASGQWPCPEDEKD